MSTKLDFLENWHVFNVVCTITSYVSSLRNMILGGKKIVITLPCHVSLLALARPKLCSSGNAGPLLLRTRSSSNFKEGTVTAPNSAVCYSSLYYIDVTATRSQLLVGAARATSPLLKTAPLLRFRRSSGLLPSFYQLAFQPQSWPCGLWNRNKVLCDFLSYGICYVIVEKRISIFFG